MGLSQDAQKTTLATIWVWLAGMVRDPHAVERVAPGL